MFLTGNDVMFPRITVFYLLLILAAALSGIADAEEIPMPREIDECRKLIDRGRFDEARERIMRYRRTHPDDPHGLMVLARLEDDVNTAMAMYREAELLAVSPRSSAPDSGLASEALFSQAEIAFSADDLKQSSALYERLVTTYPSSGRYYDAVYRLGVINLVSGEPRKALEKFRTCLEMNPDSSKRALAATGKMEAYVELRNWTEVLVAAREVLDENDEGSAVTPRVLEVIAQAWRELGNEKNAAWYTDRLLKDYPDSYQAHAIREQGSRIATDLGLTIENDGNNPDISADENAERTESVVTGQNPDGAETVTQNTMAGETGALYSVQAGAFRDRMNARKLYEKLVAAGLEARVELKDVGGSHFYKVLVGRYASRDEAEKAIGSVTKATGEKANVVITE